MKTFAMFMLAALCGLAGSVQAREDVVILRWPTGTDNARSATQLVEPGVGPAGPSQMALAVFQRISATALVQGSVASVTEYSIVMDPDGGVTLSLGAGAMRWSINAEPLSATEIVYYSRRTMAATANVDDAIYSGGTGILPTPITVADWWEGAAITAYLRLATPAGADSSRDVRLFVKGLLY